MCLIIMCREFLVAICVTLFVIEVLYYSDELLYWFRVLSRFIFYALSADTCVKAVVTISAIILCTALKMYRNDKEINHLSYVHYKTEEEYELEKSFLTAKSITELQDHPRFKEVHAEVTFRLNASCSESN